MDHKRRKCHWLCLIFPEGLLRLGLDLPWPMILNTLTVNSRLLAIWTSNLTVSPACASSTSDSGSGGCLRTFLNNFLNIIIEILALPHGIEWIYIYSQSDVNHSKTMKSSTEILKGPSISTDINADWKLGSTSCIVCFFFWRASLYLTFFPYVTLSKLWWTLGPPVWNTMLEKFWDGERKSKTCQTKKER